MFYAVTGNKPGMVYGIELKTGEKCLALFSGWTEAHFWRMAMGYDLQATDILEMDTEGVLRLLKDYRATNFNRVCLDPAQGHVAHKSFEEAMDWIRRSKVAR